MTRVVLTHDDLRIAWDFWRDKYVAPWRERDGHMRIPIRMGTVLDFDPNDQPKLEMMPVALFTREFGRRADGKRTYRFHGAIEGTQHKTPERKQFLGSARFPLQTC